LGLIGKSAHEVLADYLEVVELVEPIEIPRIVRDPLPRGTSTHRAAEASIRANT
jgi:hypothetical protein